jgi:hypothetical protein
MFQIIVLTPHRVLLQAKRSLRKGNDFLHQPNPKQDPSHVPTDGHRSKRNRNSRSHRRWNWQHLYRRCRWIRRNQLFKLQLWLDHRNRRSRWHWSLPMLMSLRRSCIPQRCSRSCRFRRSSRYARSLPLQAYKILILTAKF